VKQNVIYRPCSICNSENPTHFLTTKDFMITKESFSIVKCASCDFVYTNPIPNHDVIGDYYKSKEYISHSSSNKGLINKIYNLVRNRTLRAKVKIVQRYTKGNKILDFGSGTGHFLNECKKQNFLIEGFEPDLDAVSFAQDEFNIQLSHPSLLAQIETNSIDVITLWHVLEHVYDLKKDVSELLRVLKHDGVIIVAVPNLNSWDANFYKEFWAAYDLPRHLYHFQESTIQKLFQQFSFHLTDVLPMKYDAYYVSILSEKYKNGNIFSAIKNGFISNLKAKKHGFSSQIYVFRLKNSK
jgi:2-polyprenyl-3-methyl-5-hydroxy-6-metoxy-1,4-benzoquinol methylase